MRIKAVPRGRGKGSRYNTPLPPSKEGVKSGVASKEGAKSGVASKEGAKSGVASKEGAKNGVASKEGAKNGVASKEGGESEIRRRLRERPLAQLVDIAELLDRRLMVGNHYDRATVNAWRAVLDELTYRAPAAMREWYEDCEGSIREHMDSCGWR